MVRLLQTSFTKYVCSREIIVAGEVQKEKDLKVTTDSPNFRWTVPKETVSNDQEIYLTQQRDIRTKEHGTNK